MLVSLGLIFIVGYAAGFIVERIKLPKLLGMLIVGVVLGPYVLDLLDPSLLNISGELRSIALVIILVKAGLTINLADLKRVGRPAILMCFLPASMEIIGYTIFAPLLFNISYVEAALMGTVMGAVSPAVVVPKMVELMDKKYGTNKSIPELILAGASCDDIYVIVLFTTFLGMASGNEVNYLAFLDIPSSIILGVLLGVIVGFLLGLLFNFANKSHKINNAYKVIIMLGLAFLLLGLEDILEPYVAVSGLLATISMACVIKIKDKENSPKLANMFGQIWLLVEILLFVLIGAEVNITYVLNSGLMVVALIFLALIFRAFGVFLCLIKTKLNYKERLFCIISYLPKATVQAAIGGIPLASGLACGELILTVAVLGILITAPLGAILMNLTYKSFLEKEID